MAFSFFIYLTSRNANFYFMNYQGSELVGQILSQKSIPWTPQTYGTPWTPGTPGTPGTSGTLEIRNLWDLYYDFRRKPLKPMPQIFCPQLL